MRTLDGELGSLLLDFRKPFALSNRSKNYPDYSRQLLNHRHQFICFDRQRLALEYKGFNRLKFLIRQSDRQGIRQNDRQFLTLN